MKFIILNNYMQRFDPSDISISFAMINKFQQAQTCHLFYFTIDPQYQVFRLKDVVFQVFRPEDVVFQDDRYNYVCINLRGQPLHRQGVYFLLILIIYKDSHDLF